MVSYHQPARSGYPEEQHCGYRKSIGVMISLSRSLLLFGLAAVISAPAAHAQSVTGAGSSFAAPLYESWGEIAKAKAGLGVNYQSVGSGAGLNQVVAGTVDFGASDKPAATALLDAHHLYQFPTALGAIVVIVNVPGIPAGALQLDGPTLAALYDGRITEWNDPKIQAQNPGLNLPDADVAPIHRADASGTSFVFTSYLSHVSPEWKAHIGAGTSVAWRDGAGARGNDGVAASVKETVGGIGYVEYAYASHNHIPMARMKSHDGAYVTASPQSFMAAASQADWAHASHHVVDLLDSAGDNAWPIMSATYAIVPIGVKPETRRFFEIGLREGEQEARKLDYITVPDAVRDDILAGWPH
ncbi:Phosphate ABC transporter, periplasmic phosphate-binding protein PstS [Asaia bogorensis]|uniref:Phosphate-binding protein PstS n=2 Tax=Acetobacteraceae TaxID=433 RepID=A0A060QG83_9PROT|nr:Phosphate ABC transporter, periplasmic phosphate-binding protein PstS [Asaia bogorensis]